MAAHLCAHRRLDQNLRPLVIMLGCTETATLFNLQQTSPETFLDNLLALVTTQSASNRLAAQHMARLTCQGTQQRWACIPLVVYT